MGRRIFALCAMALIACAPRGDDEGAGMDMDTVTAAGTLTLGDMTGTWNMQTMAEDSDSVLTTFQMSGTDDPSSWTMTFPGRDPVPLRVVEIAGDSVVMDAGPFESVLRPGVMVTTRTVSRLEGAMLMGTAVATYQVTTADSVVRLRLHGTRAP